MDRTGREDAGLPSENRRLDGEIDVGGYDNRPLRDLLKSPPWLRRRRSLVVERKSACRDLVTHCEQDELDHVV